MQDESPPFSERIAAGARSPEPRRCRFRRRQSIARRAWLIQAGYRESEHLTIYRGMRVLFAAPGIPHRHLFQRAGLALLLVGVTGLGFFIPRFFLKRMITRPPARIRLGLPDGLDLTVICVEAGLSLDQAMMRVGEDLATRIPNSADEFRLVNLEMRAGKPRAEALRNLADRTGVDDIARAGRDPGSDRSLRHQHRAGPCACIPIRLRTERRQRAEEQAAKTTVKMIPPLVLFVLPSLIIVTVGPAVIQLYRTLMT